MPERTKAPIHVAVIERRIYLIRRQKVILDSDLAQLYGVTTGNLNKAVSRNLDRFPGDFMFRLSTEEYSRLRFQIGILKRGQHAKYLPRAFTEQGVHRCLKTLGLGYLLKGDGQVHPVPDSKSMEHAVRNSFPTAALAQASPSDLEIWLKRT